MVIMRLPLVVLRQIINGAVAIGSDAESGGNAVSMGWDAKATGGNGTF